MRNSPYLDREARTIEQARRDIERRKALYEQHDCQPAPPDLEAGQAQGE